MTVCTHLFCDSQTSHGGLELLSEVDLRLKLSICQFFFLSQVYVCVHFVYFCVVVYVLMPVHA